MDCNSLASKTTCLDNHTIVERHGFASICNGVRKPIAQALVQIAILIYCILLGWDYELLYYRKSTFIYKRPMHVFTDISVSLARAAAFCAPWSRIDDTNSGAERRSCIRFCLPKALSKIYTHLFVRRNSLKHFFQRRTYLNYFHYAKYSDLSYDNSKSAMIASCFWCVIVLTWIGLRCSIRASETALLKWSVEDPTNSCSTQSIVFPVMAP